MTKGQRDYAFRERGAINEDKSSLFKFMQRTVPGVSSNDILDIWEDVPRHLQHVIFRKFLVRFRTREAQIAMRQGTLNKKCPVQGWQLF